jgi:hypothetical protein
MTDLFLDTSVLLGYIFPKDRWEKSSMSCFNAPQKKWTSSSVEAEMYKKSAYVQRKVQKELLGLIMELSQGKDKPLGESDLIRIQNGLSGSKLAPVVKDLMDEIKTRKPQISEACQQLRDALRGFLAHVRQREDELKNKMTALELECWTRHDDHIDIQKKLKKYIKNDDDIEILMDAHDLASVQQLILDFVTADYEDYKYFASEVRSIVKINRIAFLHEFKAPGDT